MKDIPKDNIVCIDEIGIQDYIYKEYTKAIRSKKIYDKIPCKKSKIKRQTPYACLLTNNYLSVLNFSYD